MNDLESYIKIELREKHVFSDSFLARARLDLIDFADGHSHQLWVPLKSKKTTPQSLDGEILISINFQVDIKKLVYTREIDNLFSAQVVSFPYTLQLIRSSIKNLMNLQKQNTTNFLFIKNGNYFKQMQLK